jgi:hypothetical protein
MGCQDEPGNLRLTGIKSFQRRYTPPFLVPCFYHHSKFVLEFFFLYNKEKMLKQVQHNGSLYKHCSVQQGHENQAGQVLHLLFFLFGEMLFQVVPQSFAYDVICIITPGFFKNSPCLVDGSS